MTGSPQIGIDIRAMLAPALGGVGRYVRNLVLHLADLPDLPPTLLYADRPAAQVKLELPAQAPMRVRPVLAPRGWLRAALPLAAWRDGVRLVHFPSTVLPPVLAARRVVTVYDLAFEFFPDTYSPADLAMQRRAVRGAVRADLVIADSQSTADDLVARHRLPPERIRTIPLAAEARFFAPPPPDEQPPLGLAPGYLLYVGALQPRKNLARLIEAYAMACRQGLDRPLVLAGAGEAAHVEMLRQRAENYRVQERVIFPGYVADEALPALYRGAWALVYVSLYEGFGLPPLEAMACGTPAVAANGSCFPEVLGEAALLVDPLDVGAISRALVAIAEPRTRGQYARRGRAQAGRFSWQDTARRTLAAYRELL